MSNDKETKNKLLLSARKEFMEKGYNKASLRNICKNAGVTTGALYFFFKDKEDLFAAIVENPLKRLHEMMMEHYNGEKEDLKRNAYKDFTNDDEASLNTIHFMYQYYEEFQLLLTKAQGSRFENCVDDFVTISEKHYRMLADVFCEMTGTPRLDDYMVHMVVHIQIDAFIHLLTHAESEEEAIEHMKYTVKFLISGWYGMFNRIEK